jgi:N-acetylmuramoyl-L-alanine amidase
MYRKFFLPRRPSPALLLFFLLALLAPICMGGCASASTLPADPLSERYARARECFTSLRQSEEGGQRQAWLACADTFRTLAQSAPPGHEVRARALFMLARSHKEMHQRFAQAQDLDEAQAAYHDVVSFFPEHTLADDALFALAAIHAEERGEPERAARIFARIIALYPQGDMAPAAARELGRLKDSAAAQSQAAPRNGQTVRTIEPAALKSAGPPQLYGEKKTAPLPGSQATVLPIRHWSSNRYTRVVVETSAPVAFSHNLLHGGDDQQKRLYIDLDNSRLGPDVASAIPIDDGLLRRVRSGQFNPSTVRVVLDTQTAISDYKVFSLEDPFRVVIDVKSQAASSGPARKAQPSSPGEQGMAGRKRIVIDPGHGGKDPGAISPSGLKEKDIVLQVALMVASRLRENPAYEVILTRDRDVFVPLEERTAIANANDADLFLSIHVNAAPNRQARGIETYVLDLTNDKEAMRLAALENASSTRQMNQLQSILLDLMHNSKLTESVKLAEIVQEEVVEGLGRRQYGINNLGVKKAPFVVLIGAQMPAVLTEVGFLSNAQEEARLRDAHYLAELANHITAGVSRYADNLSLAANSQR